MPLNRYVENAVRHATQIIVGQIRKRRFRPQIIMKKIEMALMRCEHEGHDVREQRSEYNLVNSWLLSSAEKSFITVDTVVFRLVRSLPVTKGTKKKILAALEEYDTSDTTKWRSIPETEQISCDCSPKADRHISKLQEIIESRKALVW